MRWSRKPPPHKQDTAKACVFITATLSSTVEPFWDYDLWEIRWQVAEEGGYWALLDANGEEYGDLADDFPGADRYFVVPTPTIPPQIRLSNCCTYPRAVVPSRLEQTMDQDPAPPKETPFEFPPGSFPAKLRDLINAHSIEGGSNTPDFILAEYLRQCLDAFDMCVRRRDEWEGRGRTSMTELPKGPSE